MFHLKNFETYTPETLPEGLEEHAVIYFRSEDGTDFYEALSEMKEDTVKVLYIGENATVVAVTKDASSLYPAGTSLIELAAKNVPSDVDIDGRYIVDFKKRQVKLNDKVILEAAREEALAEAAKVLEGLQDKVDTNRATDEDLELITVWKSYRISVREASTLEELPKKP